MLWSDLDAKAPISIGLGPMSIKSSLRVCMVILWLSPGPTSLDRLEAQESVRSLCDLLDQPSVSGS